MLNATDHCFVCDNSKRDILKGVYCGLTDEKPVFNQLCEKIILDHKMFKRIEQVSLAHKLTENKKWLTIFNFLFFLAIALAFVIGGIILWNMAYQKGVVSTLPIVILGIGVIILPLSTGPLRLRFYEKRKNRKEEEELKAVLAIYGLTYDSKVMLKKQRHNILDVHVEAAVFKDGVKIKEHTNRFDYNNNEKEMNNEKSIGTMLRGTIIKGK